MRSAALTLLNGYKAAHAGSLNQTYAARPKQVFVKAGFVDSIDEEISYTPAGMQRTQQARIRLVRGEFATEDVAEQNDALVDGFIEYVIDNKHAAGANTLVMVTAVDDDDGWVPEWINPPTKAFYSTLVTLSGEGLFGGVT